MKIRAFLLSASVLALGWSGAAMAQTTPPPPKDDTQVDEVVVTAERRSTNLQQTPIAATVITGAKLEEKGITSVDQLQFVVPAAVINNFGQGIDFNIRGIGKSEHNSQTLTGVITYRDNIATFPGYFTGEPYYDVASVEVLRGPQGTFVGQNATGGAVFVNTNNPVVGGSTSGYIAGQLGNYADIAAQGAVSIPLGDTFAARIAFNAEQRDSFYDITGPATATGNEGLRFYNARLTLVWKPTDKLTVNFKTDYNYLNYGGYPSDPVLSPNDPFKITANAPMFARDRFVRSALRADYVFDNGITFRSVSGYQYGNTAYKADLDGRSTGFNTFYDYVQEETYSQELNLISPDTGRVKWVAGAYFQADEAKFPPGQFFIGIPPGSIFTQYTLYGTNPKQNTAVFGQVGFKLTDSLELQVGARYSRTTTTNHVHVLQYGLPITQEQSAKSNNTSGKVALNWTINPHHFVYAFVATGYKPGGLNVPVGLGLPAPFGPEKVTEYEVGWKAGFFGGQLRTQIDAFYNDYKGFQVIIGYPAFPTFGFELNNPNPTRMYGVEFQAEAVFGDLSIDAGGAWMKSELGKFYAHDPRIPGVVACDPETGPVGPGCFNLDGRDQTYAPEVTANIGIQYRFTLDNGDRLIPRLNYGYVSPQWATLFENRARGDRIEQRNIFNAQFAWTHGDVITTLYATNLTDQHYIGAINSGLRFAGPPRQFGIRVMKAF
ncbi:iron complex outermembrane receptor protein [Caulobacter ginsengisoli]|uniref:Iron complex outermembrane receptor protein n=1 Tax=Caulobacter ginsengisoli TaxID=400775 RepID=A0ABU0ISS1_9CAUL|nr:TonB-dependent receptor [Caulobacter ginsengisoli]MDQ0465034.1 iron complex outermembrane receptor protein [Caulobacter ginsengisoli]